MCIRDSHELLQLRNDVNICVFLHASPFSQLHVVRFGFDRGLLLRLLFCDVDMTVLALALDVDGTIWSDDYSIQNVARIMGIGFRPVGMNGIQKVVKWNYQCIGCKKWYKEKMAECPICGSQMRACRRK